MSKSYIPNNDQEYNTWLANFVTVLTGNAALVGLVPADLVPITDALDDFGTKLTAMQSARTAAQSATAAKVTSRDGSEDILRPLVRRINNHPGMTDALRSLLGLVPNYLQAEPTPVTEQTPLIFLEADLGSVTVHWGPNPQKENQNGKPAGVKSANIYRRKAGESSYQLVVNATKSPYIDTISGEGADYTYYVRYRGTNPGELSHESAEVTIAARGAAAA